MEDNITLVIPQDIKPINDETQEKDTAKSINLTRIIQENITEIKKEEG